MDDATPPPARAIVPWPDAARAALRQEYDRAARQPPDLRTTLLLAQLRVADGNLGEANAVLAECEFLRGETVASIDPSVLDEVLWTLFSMRRFATLGALLQDAERLPERPEIAVGHPHAEFWAVDLTITAPRHVCFTFHPTMLQGGHAKMLFVRFVSVFRVIASFVRRHVFDLGSARISLGDDDLAGALGFCSRRAEPFLIPDPYFVASRGYEALRSFLLQRPVAWGARRPVALWRGATTGDPGLPPRRWRELPRIRLCELARSHEAAGLIDAGITTPTRAAAEVAAAGYVTDPVPSHDFQHWKYQIDIDGHTNSWPGLFTKLLTGSTVIKVASPRGYRQWYYDRLKPWINFVPASADLADLAERIRWLRAHDDVAREIGRQGRVLADSLDYAGELARAGETIAAALRCVGAGGQPRPEAEVTATDVEWAYRLILGRAPESRDAIARHMANALDIDDLRRQFLASEEFRQTRRKP